MGFKGETADRRYSIDIAAFHLDWQDIQLFAQINNVGLNVNGSGAESDGFEFTATARPAPGLSLSVNGAYTDAKLSGDTDPIVGGLTGDRLPFTPEFSIALNGDYEWALTPGATAYVGGSIRALSEQSGDFDFAYRSETGRQRVVPAYEVIDLRAGVIFGRISLEAFARNVGDSDGRTSTSGLGAFPNGALGTGVIRPRTIGLSLGAEF